MSARRGGPAKPPARAAAGPGPTPRGRGRPKAGPRVRPDSRSGEYLILGYEEVIRTGTWDREAAELLLAEERVRRANPSWVKADRSVPLRVVIEHGRERAPVSAVAHLLEFWHDVPLDRLSRDLCWAYEDFRRDQPVRRRRASDGSDEADGPATGTIRLELATLGTLVRGYCEDVGVDPAPKVHLPADDAMARRFLRVREVERLMLAAGGRSWDAVAGDWRRDEHGLPLRDEAARARLRPMVRLVPCLIWTGSRVDAVLRTTWRDRADRGWFDLRIGVLFRKGRAERATRKRRPPVRLVNRLRRMVEAWAAADAAAGFDDVIHDGEGRPIGMARAWTLFAEVREAAGLDASVTLRTLRSSCAVWLLEAGLRHDEVARFLGNTTGTLSRFYDHYATEFSHAAADALDSRAY